MSVVVHLATYLRNLAGQDGAVRLQPLPANVAMAMQMLFVKIPQLKDRVCDENGAIREHVNIFVNQDNIKHLAGMESVLKDDDEIWILPAVSGG